TCQVFEGRLRRPMAFGGADAAGLDDGVLAADGVDVLQVVAAGDALYPGVRDVRAGDGVLPAGLHLVVRQVPHVPTGRLDPAGDPPQAAGPVPGAAHQARDLRDILVVLDAA